MRVSIKSNPDRQQILPSAISDQLFQIAISPILWDGNSFRNELDGIGY